MFVVMLSTTACIQSKSVNDTSAFDGGVFKSADKGNTWQQRTLIPTTTGKPRKFSSVNVAVMEMDPGDSRAIYYGSIGNGLIYTIDGGGNWEHVSNLGNITIRSIAIDPQDKCTVFVTSGNRVHKTTECTRSWENVYYDNNPATTIDAVAVDHYDSKKVYCNPPEKEKGEIERLIKKEMVELDSVEQVSREEIEVMNPIFAVHTGTKKKARLIISCRYVNRRVKRRSYRSNGVRRC